MGLVREMVVMEGKIERGFARVRRDGIIAPNLVSYDRLVGVLRFHPHGSERFQSIYFQSQTYEVDAR
jgi:hypothetical protein